MALTVFDKNQNFDQLFFQNKSLSQNSGWCESSEHVEIICETLQFNLTQKLMENGRKYEKMSRLSFFLRRKIYFSTQAK